jgi:phosphoenolpyruvate synthase/pyruvate phosphate dikinase
MSTETKNVYVFGATRTDGDAKMKNLLGGKGANLAEMCRLGIAVPPGFTISTEACTVYSEQGKDAVFKLIEADVRRASHSSNRKWARSSATRPIRCCCRCARARALRCRA